MHSVLHLNLSHHCSALILRATCSVKKEFLNLAQSYANWSPVAQLPMDQPTETARPLEFSPATKLFPGHKDLEKWRHSITFTDDKHLRYYVAFKQETFQLLMASAHSHTSLEGIYLSQTAIPRGTDQQIYPRLRLVGQYGKEL